MVEKQLKLKKMKTNIFTISFILILIILISSCKKNDYRVGGNLHNPVINMTTYDYLKSNRFGLFDTLLMLVDKAGIKDKINESGSTFFAPTDYSINRYIEERTKKVQAIDPNTVWTVDTLIKYELQNFADSLDIYIVKKEILNKDLSSAGTIFNAKKGNKVIVSYEETDNKELGYNDNSTVKPKLVYFTYLFKDPGANFNVSNIEYPVGTRTLVQTSNAKTTTGALHVLTNSHTLFYNR